MPIKVTCSKCQGVLHAPDDAGGKRGKCPTCGNVLAIPGGAGGSMIPPEPSLAPTPINTGAQTRPAPVYGTAPDSHRGSFAPGLTGPAPAPASAEPRRMPPSRMSATTDDARASGDPFTRPGPRVSPAEADELAGAWRRTRRGLWFSQVGYFFALLAVVLPAGLIIATLAGTKLPDKPGVLQIGGVPMADEIRWGAFLIPAAVAFVCLALGRLGTTNAPRSSYARGLFVWSCLATLASLLGVITVAVLVGMQVANKEVPTLIDGEDPKGIAQRIGIAVGGVFAPLGELLFVIALGRMGAGLRDDRLAARGTRFLVYLGLVYVVAGLATYAMSYFPGGFDVIYNDQINPKLNQLGDKREFVVPGVVAAVGLVVWLIYLRLVGAGRAAIHSWLDVNRG